MKTDHTYAAQMELTNIPEDSLKQWTNMPPISEELYAELVKEFNNERHYFFNDRTGQLEKSKNAYERPQPHACFILSVKDDLVGQGGIMDLWQQEARLFKFGSGTGSNFSKLRGEGEPLSGGGKSSGLMSFLKIGDRAAGAVKSGGTTRRAAKMVTLDIDHPDIEQFINWKAKEECKVASMITGSRILKRRLKEVFLACWDEVGGHQPDTMPGGADPSRKGALYLLIGRLDDRETCRQGPGIGTPFSHGRIQGRLRPAAPDLGETVLPIRHHRPTALHHDVMPIVS